MTSQQITASSGPQFSHLGRVAPKVFPGLHKEGAAPAHGWGSLWGEPQS